jgi:type II secretory pathway pseudopilin PulG
MTRTLPNRNQRKPSEEGYILLGVIFLLALLTIAMAVAIPRITAQIQRDREVETMHRGKQYIRAIQLYYRKFNAYPPNMDALVKTNEIRFLRKKYIDPTTGKDEWKPIHFGENKTPMAMGFFGQPLGGTGAGGAALAGTGPGGGNGVAGASSIGGGMSGSSGGFGSSSGGFGSSGSSFGSTSSGFGSSGSSLSSSPTGLGGGSTFGSSSNGTTAAAGSSGTTDGSSTASGTTGTGTTGTTGTDANGNSTTTGGSSPGSSPIGGQTFGGAGIIGVSPASPKLSILVYKKKTHYNEWEFLYSPLSDQMTMSGGNAGAIGQPAGGTGTSGTTPSTGGTSSGSTFGSSTTTSPTTSTGTTPQ